MARKSRIDSRRKFECVNCGEEFSSGNWAGCYGVPTQEHKVERKMYYCSWSNGFQYCLKKEKTLVIPDGDGQRTVQTPRKVARFHKGQFSTDDPEIQEVLDKDRRFCSKEKFIDSKLTPQAKMRRREVVITEQQRLIGHLQSQLAQRKEQPVESESPAD